MKVIIELNNFISLEFHEGNELSDEVRIWFEKDTVTQTSAAVKIYDLKLALKKMIAR